MATAAAVAETIARGAVREAVARAERLRLVVPAPGDEALPEQSRRATERLVTQDPTWRSWRLWGGFWGAVTGLLAIPEVQTAIHAIAGATVPAAYLPVVTAILAALWPVISKARDPRPVRGQL